MIKIVLFILLSIPVFSLSAQEGLNCRLRTIEPSKSYLLGEPLDMELVLWPKDQLDIVSLLANMKPTKIFIDSFYINKVVNVEKSPNNVDAVVLHLEVVPIKPFDISILPIYSDGKNSCPVEIKGFEFSSQKIKPKIAILKQPADPLPSPSRIWLELLFSILGIVLLVGIIWIIVKIQQKKSIKHKILLRKKYFKTLIDNASSRSDIERFYLLRDEWNKLLKAGFSHDSFLQIITPILYKQYWSDEELKECLNKMKSLKEGFDD